MQHRTLRQYYRLVRSFGNWSNWTTVNGGVEAEARVLRRGGGGAVVTLVRSLHNLQGLFFTAFSSRAQFYRCAPGWYHLLHLST